MAGVLLVTDADWLFDDVSAALCGDGTTVSRINSGLELRAATAALQPDLVILDMQTGNMGGIANSIDLRLEEGAGRIEQVPILLLLDRDCDRWLARKAGADGWMVKPLDPFRIRKASRTVVAGQPWFEGEPVITPVLETSDEVVMEGDGSELRYTTEALDTTAGGDPESAAASSN